MIRTYYDPGFAAPLGEKHIMPMSKFALVAEQLRKESWVDLAAPAPVSEQDLLRAHDAAYVAAVRTGEPRALAESQKFPWSPQLYGSVLLTNGGILAAAGHALRAGSAAALASGFHHSHHVRGEGFCTFNGLIVALEALRNQDLIRTAAILDMDLHYGNGTAQLAESRPWLRALSLYGNDYWDNTAYRDVSTLHHRDGTNHRSAALPAGCDRAEMMHVLDANIDFLLDPAPDLLLYQAGADPYFEDPYSPLSLNHDDLQERDRRVFEIARDRRIPIAWVLAGGYTTDITKIVRVHVNTFHAWRAAYGG
jgi:acetoin utilization deacetylase AcuC-like enzyme